MTNQLMVTQTFLDQNMANNCGFAMSQNDILLMATISQQLLTGVKQYVEAEREIKSLVHNAFIYREGNKRIVIVSIHQRFVIKIAKLAGFEGIRDNMNEQASCLFMNTKSAFKELKYAPGIIATYGTAEYPGLVLVQERHREILEEISSKLGVAVREEKLIEEYVKAICITGYLAIKKMIDNIATECFVSDLPLVRSAANFSMNAYGGFAVLDWGSILPKNGYEVRCPKCKAPMIYHVEDQDVFTSTMDIRDMNIIKPTYRCVANDAHELDPDLFFSKLTAGDQSIIMPLAEAQAYIQNINAQKAQIQYSNPVQPVPTQQDMPTQQMYQYNGMMYNVGSLDYNNNGVIYKQLFQNNMPTKLYINGQGQIVQG